MLNALSALTTCLMLTVMDATQHGQLRRTMRGLTFLEYALLAAIVLGFAVYFRSNLKTAISGVIDKVTKELAKS